MEDKTQPTAEPAITPAAPETNIGIPAQPQNTVKAQSAYPEPTSQPPSSMRLPSVHNDTYRNGSAAMYDAFALIVGLGAYATRTLLVKQVYSYGSRMNEWVFLLLFSAPAIIALVLAYRAFRLRRSLSLITVIALIPIMVMLLLALDFALAFTFPETFRGL